MLRKEEKRKKIRAAIKLNKERFGPTKTGDIVMSIFAVLISVFVFSVAVVFLCQKTRRCFKSWMGKYPKPGKTWKILDKAFPAEDVKAAKKAAKEAAKEAAAV